jgi:excisionase family DNA binding protein
LAEAAERFGLTTGHLRKLARAGKLQTVKVGHYWVTTEEAVQAYIAEGHKPGPKPKERRRPGGTGK